MNVVPRPCGHEPMKPEGACGQCDLYRTHPKIRAAWDKQAAEGKSFNSTIAIVPGPTIRARCAYLGDPISGSVGCCGYNRDYECDHIDPRRRALHLVAVPAGNCQTCNDWSDTINPADFDPTATGAE